MLSELRSTSSQPLYFEQSQADSFGNGIDMNPSEAPTDARERIDRTLGIKRAVKNVLRGQDRDPEYQPIKKKRFHKQEMTEQKQTRTKDTAKERQKANRERKKQRVEELEKDYEWLEGKNAKLSGQIRDLKVSESFYKSQSSELQVQNNILQEKIRHLQEENSNLRGALEKKLNQETLLAIVDRL